jgi:hypothetical protein
VRVYPALAGYFYKDLNPPASAIDPKKYLQYSRLQNIETMSLISRADFDALWIECCKLLPLYGFQFLKVDIDPSVSVAFESCFEMVGDIEKAIPRTQIPLPLGFDPRTLNIITLDMGCLAIKMGIISFQYNECLNCLREGIVRVIEVMGYQKPTTTNARWQCYKRWEDLARAAGMDEEGIRAAREWCQIHQGHLFEI